MAIELAKAYVQIIPSADGLGNSIKEQLEDETKDPGESAGKSLGNSMISAVKKVVIAAGIGETIKKSLDAGGAIQQSFGGLDTLYGEASSAAKKYAQDAVTAGISANNYAEQAVSFGAALKSAFGGDVAKAAEAANIAIMDMADNSAKMGTDMGLIQNAYQGFAKGNYTMLDNLKLGYGGTQEEMKRLLKDAQELSGVEYDISNLGDVYSAIHVIQEDLGLTGVAAYEAGSTFSGSFGAMQAAAENLLASLSAEEMDVTPQLQALVDSTGTFLIGNLLPMVGRIAMSIPEVIGTTLSSYLPDMLKSGAGMLAGLAEGFRSGFPMMGSASGEMVKDTISSLAEGGVMFLTAGMDMLAALASGFLDNAPTMISAGGDILAFLLEEIISYAPKLLNSGADLLLSLVTGILKNMPAIASAAVSVIGKLIYTIASNSPKVLQEGISLVGKLLAGIIKAIPQIPGCVLQIISSIVKTFTGYNWLSIGKNIMEGIKNGITGAIGSVIGAAKSAAGSILSSIKEKLGIHSPSKPATDFGRFVDVGLANGIQENLGYVDHAVEALKNVTLGNLSASYSVSTNSAYGTKMEQMLYLLSIIADKDLSITLNGRELKRQLVAMGVATV